MFNISDQNVCHNSDQKTPKLWNISDQNVCNNSDQKTPKLLNISGQKTPKYTGFSDQKICNRCMDYFHLSEKGNFWSENPQNIIIFWSENLLFWWYFFLIRKSPFLGGFLIRKSTVSGTRNFMLIPSLNFTGMSSSLIAS